MGSRWRGRVARRMSIYPSLKRAFGLTGEEFTGGVALHYRDGTVVAQSERPEDLHGEHAGRAWVYVVVEDPDAHYEDAKAEGVEVLGEIHEAFDGAQRGYSARDPEGNLWTFATASPDAG
jgi:uncharacterized glyoxalase superfamily protein PhnB